MRLLNWLTRLIQVESTFQLDDDDIVVFVVGPTGSGKSTFVRAVTQAPGLIGVGQSLQAFQAIRCELTEEARIALEAKGRKNIVFVDTPSFHTASYSSGAEEMSTWLKQSKCKSTRLGTIYMHRIEMDPATEEVQHHLDAFATTFPEDFVTRAFPMPLHCVFSCVDEIQIAKIADHQAKFKKQLGDLRPQIVHGFQLDWKASIHPELFVKGDPDTAWQAVEKLFSAVHSRVGFRGMISQEMPGDEPQPEEEDKLSESQTDSSDDQVPMLESDEEEDVNGRWIDERFGPDSSNLISMSIFS